MTGVCSETGAEAPGADVRSVPKGEIAMIYGEPETIRFLAAVQRLKRLQQRRERRTKLAKQRVRAALRKLREC
jgi:hypothetical protein